MSDQPGGTGDSGVSSASTTGAGGGTGPTVFSGRYELQRKLARGGMADVYLAEDKLLNRPVAVKVLFAEYARDETFVERFRREAQAAARLTHGNIVAIYDWGAEYGTYFIVMEYVEGASLSEVIRRDGPLDPQQAAEITARVAAALDFAHHNGVVHRDVKPGNIMISEVGEVKVADFGIAQAASGPERASLTQTGAVMGTATYFSPEQAQGRSVDPRSDLYSLGCVLFEMLTGRPPYQGDSPVAIAYKHVQEPPPTLDGVTPPVPAELAAIVAVLLRKLPEERYATAADLQRDLQRFLAGQHVAATTAPPATAMAPQAGAATAAVATSAGMGLPPGPPPPGTTPPVGSRNAWAVAALVLALVVVAIVLFLIGSSLSRDNANVIEVPQVIGRPVAEARAAMEDIGLTVTVREEVNEFTPEGNVIDQNPSGGTRVQTGSSVELRVSAGRGDAEVPDVVGRTEAEAIRILTNAEFLTNVELRENNTVPEGRVISQEPGAGGLARKRATVTLVVSSGSRHETVPNLVGQTEGDAANQLGRLDLTVQVQREYSADQPEGVVIATQPGGGEQVPKGSTVVLIVSRGPAPTTTTAAPAPPPPTTAVTTAPANPGGNVPPGQQR
jgi:eukaryotic-like serine/threonine-protein kinase